MAINDDRRQMRGWWRLASLALLWSLAFGAELALAKRSLTYSPHEITEETLQNVLTARLRSFFGPGETPNTRVWPVWDLLSLPCIHDLFLSCYLLLLTKIELDDHIMEQDMEFGWRVVLGSIIGFLGAALGSIGGVGGGGIFVPMLTLIIGFDPKTSTAISKCKIPDLCYLLFCMCFLALN